MKVTAIAFLAGLTAVAGTCTDPCDEKSGTNGNNCRNHLGGGQCNWSGGRTKVCSSNIDPCAVSEVIENECIYDTLLLVNDDDNVGLPTDTLAIKSYDSNTVTWSVTQKWKTSGGISWIAPVMDTSTQSLYCNEADKITSVAYNHEEEYTAYCNNGVADIVLYVHDGQYNAYAQDSNAHNCNGWGNLNGIVKYEIKMSCVSNSYVCNGPSAPAPPPPPPPTSGPTSGPTVDTSGGSSPASCTDPCSEKSGTNRNTCRNYLSGDECNWSGGSTKICSSDVDPCAGDTDSGSGTDDGSSFQENTCISSTIRLVDDSDDEPLPDNTITIKSYGTNTVTWSVTQTWKSPDSISWIAPVMDTSTEDQVCNESDKITSVSAGHEEVYTAYCDNGVADVVLYVHDGSFDTSQPSNAHNCNGWGNLNDIARYDLQFACDASTTVCSESNPSGSNGDPHFKTWKNEHFEYHGQCDMILARDDKFADGLGLEVQIRTKLVRFWSYIKQAAIRIGEDILEVQGSGEIEGTDPVYWYNLEHRGEMTSVGGFPVSITTSSTTANIHKIKIDLSSKYPGQSIRISTYREFVRVDFDNGSAESFGETVGLLGDFRTGKTLARDGTTVMEDFGLFGNEWQVLPSEDMLFHDFAEPQFPRKCIEPEDPQGERRRLREDTVTHEEAEKACSHLRDPLDQKDCIYDVLATQDIDMVGAF